jgi:thioredoxin 1
MAEEFNDANWDREVLGSPVPVLVDFWAPWCQPCRHLAPTIDQVAKELAGVARVGKVNADENPGLAATYDVSKLPTLLFFRNGRLVYRMLGIVPKERIKEELEALRADR